MSEQSPEQIQHYRLDAKLGEGGMGVVWKAQDTRLDREVALKLLPKELAEDPERLARFERESKAVAALNHPNIVTIYSFERGEESPFITMELVDGKSLDQVIPHGGMPVEKFLDLAIPMTDAVAAAHEKGITHRDLKPANVMVGPDGRAKILDFGLAKLADKEEDLDKTERQTLALTQAGKLLGTIPYMSPEQVKSQDVDHRSDIFSLGTIFYEMATGSLPFEGDSSADMISSILRDKPSRVTDSNPSMPVELDKLLRHSLEKDPEKRYQTAEEFREDLDRLRRGWITGEISVDRALRASERRTARGTNGGRKALLAVAGVAAVAAIAVVGANLLQRDTPVSAGSAVARGSASGAAAASSGTPSVAVLPFDNISADDNDEYFSDGLTEELINRLSRVDGINVAARTSVFALKGAGLTIQEVGERLGVDKVIEGSVRRAGDRVRLSVQLVNVADGLSLWTESYDRDISDVFTVQDEVASSIAENLRIQLVEANTPAREMESEAYDVYLQGRYAWNKRTEDGIRNAIELFRGAIQADPDFALAYAGLADSFVVLPGYTDASREDVEASFELANEYATKALEIQPELAEALTSRAAYLAHKGKIEEAEQFYQRAIDVNPSYANAHHWYAILLRETGRVDKALYHLDEAAGLDPLSRVVRTTHADLLTDLGRYDEGLKLLARVAEIDPDYPIDEFRARTAYYGREFGESLSGYERLVDEADLSVDDYERMANAYHLTGRYGEELSTAKRAEEVHGEDNWTVHRLFAQAFIGLQRPDRAVRRVREGIERATPQQPWSAIEMFYIVRALDVAGYEQQSVALARELIAYGQRVEDSPFKQALGIVSAYLLVLAGDVEQGRERFESMREFMLSNPKMFGPEVYFGVSGSLAAMVGDEAIARRRETELSSLPNGTVDGIRDFWRAGIAAQLGETDRAVDLLGAAFEQRYADFMDIYQMPFFDPLYSTSEFKALMADLRLPVPPQPTAPGAAAAPPSPPTPPTGD